MDITVVPLKEQELKPLFTNPEELGFGKVFTDRMFTMEYKEGIGWHNPTIRKYEPLSMDPATLVLHYGQEIFEGMKAFAGPDEQILFFRPEENVRRFNRSARRMSMPELKEEDMLQAIVDLVRLEKRWIPRTRGAALYIRPALIASEVGLGVRPSKEYLFFIILSPVGPYFKQGFRPVDLWVTDNYVRAVEGGVGEAKTGGNYAASLLAKREAQEKGYNEVLWLDARERKYIEEVGAMNICFVIDGVITTPLLDGAILAGITRKSVLQLASHLGYPIAERKIAIAELMEGIQSGRVSEAFGVGTAASIAPVGAIGYQDRKLVINGGEVGPVAHLLYRELQAIQYGEKKDLFGWVLAVPTPQMAQR
jgi:branched-chain amino acid aminotransferase